MEKRIVFMRVKCYQGFILICLLCLMSVGIISCKTTQSNMTIEEAKKLTADFSKENVQLPPRSIKDVLDKLNSSKGFDSNKIETARKQSKQNPPNTMRSDKQLSKFYYQRSGAAIKAGDFKQALSDINSARNYAEKGGANKKTIIYILQRQAHIYDLNGEIKQCIEIMREMISRSDPQSTAGMYYQGDLALRLYRAGHFEEAAEFMKEAFNKFKKNKNLPYWRKWRNQLNASMYRFKGNLTVLQGEFSGAEAQYQKARAAAITAASENISETGTMVSQSFKQEALGKQIDIEGRIALCMEKLGKNNEALYYIRGALKKSLELFGVYSSSTAEAVTRFGLIRLWQSHYDDAEALLKKAYEISIRIGNYRAIPEILLRLAEAHLLKNDIDGAFNDYNELLKYIDKDSFVYDSNLDGNINYAIVLLKSGKIDEAKTIIDSAIYRRDFLTGKDSYAYAEAIAIKALEHRYRSNYEKSYELFEQAFQIFVREGNQIENQTRNNQFRLRLIIESYLDLILSKTLLQISDTDRTKLIERSFHYAQLVQRGGSQVAVVAWAARRSMKDENLSDLIRREQDAAKQLETLYSIYNDIVSDRSEVLNNDKREKIGNHISAIADARKTLLAEIEAQYPDYAKLLKPGISSVLEIQHLLKDDESLITTFVGNERMYVWAINSNGMIDCRSSEMGIDTLDFNVNKLRKTLTPASSKFGDILKYDTIAAYRIYEALLKPLEDIWKNSRNLIVYPDRTLGHLPLSILLVEKMELPGDERLLFDGYRKLPWLVRSHSITTVPSVSALSILRKSASAQTQKKSFVGFGDPWFSPAHASSDTTFAEATARKPIMTRGFRFRGIRLTETSNLDDSKIYSCKLENLTRLPDTAEEIRSIAQALNADLEKDIFLGMDANEDRIKNMVLNDRKVIAFATHGLLPGDIDGLHQPALALSAPNVYQAEGDGLLTMQEIFGLRLNADCVVLSACNTGAADGNGAEAASGLGRAFFFAGAKSLLLTNWPVETRSAKYLTSNMFGKIAANQISYTDALRLSMLDLLDKTNMKNPQTGKNIVSYAHPIFWGAFTLMGDGSQ